MQEAATKAIDIREFVPNNAVDPIFFEKSYYLGPDKGGARPYALLAAAMRQSGLAGVAQYAARGKQYLVLVRATEQGLVMHQLHYADQIRTFDEVPMGDEVVVGDAELALALQIVSMSTKDEFKPEQYRDTVKERLEQLIQARIDGEEVVTADAPAPKADVVDLMAALKASLAIGSDLPKTAEQAG